MTHLSFNQLAAPLVMAFLFTLVALSFWDKVRKAAQNAAQLERLNSLNPPKKGQNHRSIPPRQYYLTRNMAKPTPAEEHVLEVYVKLHRERVAAAQPRKK